MELFFPQVHAAYTSVLFVCFVFWEWTVEVRPLRMSTLHVFRWMTKSGATSSVTCLYTFYHHQAVWPGDLRFLIHWLKLECWIFPQWVKTLCYFHPSRSIFIAVVGLGFSCLFGFRVLLSITQYKQQEQICVVISDTLFRQHSIKAALHPRSYKELPACPLKVTPNLPSGQWSWVTMIAKTGRKRHIELAPYLIFTTVDLWRINGIDHSIIVQTWKYRKNQELDQYTPQLPKTQLIYLFKSSFFLS